jgi:hypothetical protein
MRVLSVLVIAVLMLQLPELVATQPYGAGPTRTHSYVVNIKTFGATGNGRTDDTGAVQAAIDYAYANHVQTIFCPSGDYVTSSTIYLDRPRNLRSNFVNPSNSSFSLAFIGEDLGIGNSVGFGCQLRPNFNNNIAFIVGPGHDMKVSGISVIGPNNGYRGNLNTSGIGIGIAGGGGGAHHTIIENTFVANFYQLYMTDANGGCCLSDSNNFDHVSGDNGYYGVRLTGTQSFINKLDEPTFSNVTVGISDIFSHQVTVTGGNISPFSSVGGAFRMSDVSGLTLQSDRGFTFTGVIASPDRYWPNVYNSFTIVTKHFGIVPLTLDSWDAGTSSGTFHITPAWATANFGDIDLSLAFNSSLARDIQAVTTIYAAERVTIVQGMGVSLEGVHIENPNACQTLYYVTSVWAGAKRGTLKNLFFDSDPGLANYVPANRPTQQQLAWFYCQQAFPFVGTSAAGAQGRLDIDGGDFAQNLNSPPLLFELYTGFALSARELSGIAQINERVWDTNWFSYQEPGGFGQIDTQFNGAGDWDNDYFLPHALDAQVSPCPNTGGNARCVVTEGHLAVPFRGYRPAEGQAPNLSPDLYALVSGALGDLGTYPPIDCETIYHSIAHDSGALAHIHVRSASCPGYSWGQNLTDTLVGETVTWSYMGQSTALYLDAKTLSWMFPGLGLTIPGSFNADPYIVTGVYPQLGYVTVIDAAANMGAPLQGDKATVYSCATGCSIGQAAYSWTAY